MRTRALVIATSLLFATACGGPLKYKLESSARAPGADAKLVADVHEKGNMTSLELNAEHLPSPSRIAQGATTYVAWYRESSKQTWQRLGGLEYDDDSREGHLQVSVPATQFDFEVTAESEPAVASPSSDAVFTQRVQRE